MSKRKWTRARALLVVISLSVFKVSRAAEYDANKYQQLLAEANANGFVGVMITLGNYSLADIGGNAEAVRAATEAKAQAVLAELGQNALVGGYWNSGIGQMGVQVNAQGLQMLVASSTALGFMRDPTHGMRVKVATLDGSVDALKAELNRSGVAEVDIFLNVDAVDYDLASNGATVFRPAPPMAAQLALRLNNIVSQPYASGLVVKEEHADKPVVRATIDRSAFHGLIASDDVRAVRLVGFSDSRVAQWPQDLIAAAQQQGALDLTISLRGGAFFSVKTGYLSEAAIAVQTEANRRAFADIFSRAGIAQPTSQSGVTGYTLGTLVTRLSAADLLKLYQSADARVWSVQGTHASGSHTADNVSETTLSPEPTEYCIDQTAIRGGFENLIIDHNVIVPPEHQLKKGDVFVAARFRSKPDSVWLLSGTRWRKIDGIDDLLDAQHRSFDALPLVIPVSVFYEPIDARAAAGDAEIWIGYGLRSAGDTRESFEEMMSNRRYERLWAAPAANADPASGGRQPGARLCMTTTAVKRSVLDVESPITLLPVIP